MTLGPAIRKILVPAVLPIFGAGMLMLPAVSFAAGQKIEKHFSVKGRPVVMIQNVANGRIEVKSWKNSEVVVSASQSSDKIGLDMEQADERIEITANILDSSAQQSDLTENIQLTVPEETELQIKTQTGLIYVEQVIGDMKLESVAGDVHLKEVSGVQLHRRQRTNSAAVIVPGRSENHHRQHSLRRGFHSHRYLHHEERPWLGGSALFRHRLFRSECANVFRHCGQSRRSVPQTRRPRFPPQRFEIRKRPFRHRRQRPRESRTFFLQRHRPHPQTRLIRVSSTKNCHPECRCSRPEGYELQRLGQRK